MKITQGELVLEWVKIHGKITPAKMAGFRFMGGMFGSEVGRCCRALRANEVLNSERDGKFTTFSLNTVREQLKII